MNNKENRMNAKYIPREMYLCWFNDFLTVKRFAEYFGISPLRAHRLINVGRERHEQYVIAAKLARKII
jgi:hypothetical protein